MRQNWLVCIISPGSGPQALGRLRQVYSDSECERPKKEVFGGCRINWLIQKNSPAISQDSKLGRDSIYLNHITSELGWAQFLGEFFFNNYKSSISRLKNSMTH